MLKEKDLDIVLVGTPDHWHALPMIAAVEAGADVYVQKPISVDVVEGQAMVAAARKHKRVVQVGTQRRSTPHLVEARDRVIKEGKLGKIGLVEVCCYYHMRDRDNPPDTDAAGAPRLRDVDRPGPAAAATTGCVAPALVAGVHGVRQRHHGRHVHPHARHGPLDARPGLAEAHHLDRRHPGAEGAARRTSPTRSRPRSTSATCTVVWQHRTWGQPADPEYPWGATIYGDKGTLKASVNSYDFIPLGKTSRPLSGKAARAGQVPRGQDREGPGAARRRGQPPAPAGLPAGASPSRGRPVADIEQGHISTASCILANLSMSSAGR